jgi:tetratricopeptide (TPR) repeat protein
MKRIIILSFLVNLSIAGCFAQHSQIFTNSDAQFYQGRELYFEGKFAASYCCIEEYLKKADSDMVSQLGEAEYYLAADAYQLRKEDAAILLKNILVKQPYTPFFDPINFMVGMLELEKKNYNQALNYFDQVKENHLGQHDCLDYLFSKGYASIQTQNYTAAYSIFSDLKNRDSRYTISATYYFAYSAYCLKDYAAALPEFLKLENNPAYDNIVSYYILQIYYVQKNYDQLNDRVENLLKKNPVNKNNAEIYRIAGEIAYRNHDYKKAISFLKSYEKLFPQVVRNDMYLLGLSYFQLNDYPNAVSYLSKVTTEKDEMTENAYLHLGNSYIKLKDYLNARLAYEASLRTSFNKIVREEALFNYALTSYDTTSAFGESISAFEEYLAEFPDSKYSDKAYDYLSSVYMTTKNYDAAFQSISRIKSPNAKLLETKQYLLYQLGTEAFAQNNPEKAIEYFTLSLQSSLVGKYSAECLYWRAECYYRTNRSEQAIADLNAFFNNGYSGSSVNRVIANYSIAYALFSKKNYTESLNWFLKYVKLESNTSETTYPDALNRIGDCYFYERNFTKAQSYYTKAISANPKTADYALFQTAYVCGLQKDYSLKISKLESLISQYPTSDYTDDALYEMGRAYLMMENNAKAISSYQRLLDSHPIGDLARKAALEIGMIYFNIKDYDRSISAYKNVISKYPGTEEANTALESLETVYIETNDVPAYLAYTKTLGYAVKSSGINSEDSISFIAAQRQYMNENYDNAIIGMENYLNKYCPGGHYCTTAEYYMADSYYQKEDKANALKAYQALTKISGNQYFEEAVTRCAEITYDQKEYASALTYFTQLQDVAQSTEKKNAGRLGILRCCYFLNDYQTTVNIVNEITTDPHADKELKTEALYNRAKAYLALNRLTESAADLKALAADTHTEKGAEAKYLLADLYYKQGNMTDAEAEVMDFAKKNTPYPFWLARSFVLLSDVYIKQNNDFQAKQYLLSLQKNYKTADEIQTLITDRLNAIGEREKKTIVN